MPSGPITKWVKHCRNNNLIPNIAETPHQGVSFIGEGKSVEEAISYNLCLPSSSRRG